MSTLRPEHLSNTNDLAGTSAFDRKTSLPHPTTNMPSHLGRFKLERSVGRGAMGEVWKAYDPVRDGPVVIKLLPPELLANATEVERVRSSFLTVHALQHRHICPVYDLENDPQVGLYLVMKYIEGDTLAEYWNRVRPRSKLADHAVVARLLAPIADALDYAHKQGVVHRDVKPANILMDHGGEEPQLVDFGLAAIIATSITRISQARFEVAGTPAFMAPEQFRGRRPNGKADQYALASVAYEMISGGVPFEAHDPDTLRQCVLTEPIARIEGLPNGVMRVLDVAMSKAPQQRFDSCTQFIAALQTGTLPRGKRCFGSRRNQPKRKQGLLLATATLACAAAATYVFSDPRSFLASDAARSDSHNTTPFAKLDKQASSLASTSGNPMKAEAVEGLPAVTATERPKSAGLVLPGATHTFSAESTLVAPGEAVRDNQRSEALAAKELADAQRATAEEAYMRPDKDSHVLLTNCWNEAQSNYAEALASLEAEDYLVAKQQLAAAEVCYRRYTALANLRERVEQVAASLEAVAIDRTALDESGSPQWKKTQQLLRTVAESEQYDDVVAAYEELEQVLPAALELAQLVALLQEGNYQHALHELDKAYPGELEQGMTPIFNEAARHVPGWWLSKGESLVLREPRRIEQLASLIEVAAACTGTADANPQMLADLLKAIGEVNDPAAAGEKLGLLLALEELCEAADQRTLRLEVLRTATALANILDTNADWLVARAREKEEFSPRWRAMCEIAARYHRAGENAEATRLLELALANQRRAEGSSGEVYLACYYYALATSNADLKLFEAGQHEVVSYWSQRTRTEQRAYQLLLPLIASRAWQVGNTELAEAATVQAENALSNRELWNNRRVTEAREVALMANLYGAQGDLLMCQSHVNLLNKYVSELREAGDRYGYLPYFEQSLAEAMGALAHCLALNGQMEKAITLLEVTPRVNLSDCRQTYRLWAGANIHNLAVLRIRIKQLPSSSMQTAAYAGVSQAVYDSR